MLSSIDGYFRQLVHCCTTVQAPADALAADFSSLQLTDASIHNTRSRGQLAASATAAAPYRLFTFDIETTGLSPSKDAIVELAIVDVASGSHHGCLVRPVPYRKSSKDAFRAHGITDAMLGQPGIPSLPEAWQAMKHFVDSHTPKSAKPIIVAHNGYTFDFKMLASNLASMAQEQQAAVQHAQLQQQEQQQQLMANGSNSSYSSAVNAVDGEEQQQQSEGPDGWLVLDTLHLLRNLKFRERTKVENLQQTTLVQHFTGSPPDVAHRALADAQQLALLLPHILEWAAEVAGPDPDDKLLPHTFASTTAAVAAAAAARRNTANGAVAARTTKATSSNRVGKTSSRRSSSSQATKQAGAVKDEVVSVSTQGVCGDAISTGKHLGNVVVTMVAAAALVELDRSPTSAASLPASVMPGVAAQQQQQRFRSGSRHSSLHHLDHSLPEHQLQMGQDVQPAEQWQQQQHPAAAQQAPSQYSQQQQWQQHGLQSSQAPQAPSNPSSSPSFNRIPASSSSTKGQISSICQDAAAAAVHSIAVIKGKRVAATTSSAFVQAVHASILDHHPEGAGGTNGSSNGLGQLNICLGPRVEGKADPNSGFYEVLWGHNIQPVACRLDGVVIAKDLKFTSSSNHCIHAISMLVMGAGRQQQQQLLEFAEAVNSLTALLGPQQQQQQVFKCMSGKCLVVRLPCKKAPPLLDMIIRQSGMQPQAVEEGSSNTLHFSNVTSACFDDLQSPAVTVSAPSLAHPDAAAQLQRMLAVGQTVSLTLWPSCVWSNSKYRGVTLSCVELLLA